MIVIGDIQIQNKNAHLHGTRSLFTWLLENYKNEVIVQVGDFWNESRPNNIIEDEFIGYLKQFKKGFHILMGNHDTGDIAGNSLAHLKHHDNIFIYDKIEKVCIDGYNCLMLPFNRNMKSLYEPLKYNGDFCFIHGEPIEGSYAQTGIDLKDVQATQIYGHIHQKKIISDKKIVLGCVVPNACNEINNPIMKVENGVIECIEHPIWFEYEDIDYGVIPENKNNIYNIKKAPSIISVYEMYKGYHIKEEGIELLIDETISADETFTFSSGNVKDQFVNYAKEKGLRDELVSKSLSYIRI